MFFFLPVDHNFQCNTHVM